jgi:hypothetical protein
MDLDLYHARISSFVTGIIVRGYRLFIEESAVLKYTKDIAECNSWIPNFVFQDETQAHYNNDIAKECQRRLGA